MALKAGYVGVKRFIYENLLKDVSTLEETTYKKDVESEMGAKNLLVASLSSSTTQGITFIPGSDNTITVTGPQTASANANYIIDIPSYVSGDLLLSGCPDGGGAAKKYDVYCWDNTANARPKQWDGTTASLSCTKESDSVQVKLVAGHANKVYVRVQKDFELADGSTLTFKPMLRSKNEPDNTYAVPAMTNQQLTTEVSSINTDLESHKTEINAIISAATGAADFAAFKTAMAALTPLTRTAPQEETRSVDPEIDEEVTKKTTKKTTKKEVE